MAKNLSSRGAFDVENGSVPRLASRRAAGHAPSKEDLFQLNCLVTPELKVPLQVARAKEAKTSGEIVEPLLREYLSQGGYLD